MTIFFEVQIFMLEFVPPPSEHQTFTGSWLAIGADALTSGGMNILCNPCPARLISGLAAALLLLSACAAGTGTDRDLRTYDRYVLQQVGSD